MNDYFIDVVTTIDIVQLSSHSNQFNLLIGIYEGKVDEKVQMLHVEYVFFLSSKGMHTSEALSIFFSLFIILSLLPGNNESFSQSAFLRGCICS